MFEGLTGKLQGVFRRLGIKGRLSEKNIEEGLRTRLARGSGAEPSQVAVLLKQHKALKKIVRSGARKGWRNLGDLFGGDLPS